MQCYTTYNHFAPESQFASAVNICISLYQFLSCNKFAFNFVMKAMRCWFLQSISNVIMTRSHLFLEIYFDCNAEIYPAKRVFLYLFAKLYLQPALVTEIVEIEEKMFCKAPLNLSSV